MRCATLAAQLRPTSRVAVASDESRAWDEKTHLLRLIEYTLRVLLWSMGDPKRRGEFPEPIEAPGEAERKKALVENAEMVADLVAEAFGL